MVCCGNVPEKCKEITPSGVHPAREDLERFLRCELTREQARTIVRHLLSGCPQCQEVAAGAWTGAAQALKQVSTWRKRVGCRRGREEAMTEDEALAQSELREIIKVLSTQCLRLEGIHDRLPVAPNEDAMLQGEAELDVATEVRGAIECVLHEQLRPAISGLQGAATYRPQGETSG
jgi:hypothetical protein